MRIRTLRDGYRLLHEGSIALSQVEHNGIKIDVDYLEKAIKETDNNINELRKQLKSDKIFSKWKRQFREKTNLGSREQLATILFDVMGIPSPGYTDKSIEEGKKRYRSDEAVLAKIDLPFIPSYLRYQRLLKVRSTYLEGIRREIQDGYLHPSFNLHKVITYRSSSSDPNFQNIPIRIKEIGELIRKCFIPRKGRRLVEIDYSGIEVRASVWYHKDPVLKNYVEDPTTDMHRDTAMQLFFIKKEEVDKRTTRDWSKNRFVFPQFYGSVYFQCAPHIWEAVEETHKDKVYIPGTEETIKQRLKANGINTLGKCDAKERPVPGTFEFHVKKVEDNFWNERFRVYAEWKKKWFFNYLRNGYFDLLTGFRVNGLLSKNDSTNYPVQGVAFHCLLWSLIRTQKYISKNKLVSKLVGQIHDSLIGDVHPREEQDYLSVVKEIMTVKCPKHWPFIITPLDIEAELTPIDGSWHEKKLWIVEAGIWKKAPEKK